MTFKTLTTASGYKTLVRKVERELSELEFFVKRRTAEGYWKIGKYIHEHLLENKERADYGAALYEQLAKDVDRDISTLQRSVQFYRTYPISAYTRKLSWEHYKSLITVKDEEERKELEQKVIRLGWDTIKLRKYLSTKRKAARAEDQPVTQLTFTRGKLHTYQIIEAGKPLVGKSPLVLDLGFRQEYVIPQNAARFKEGDFAELLFKREVLVEVKKVETGLPVLERLKDRPGKPVSTDNLFTYKAYVEKIVDGDTLLVSFDFHLEVSISQKLRLRGIDCPEIDTEEGQRARRFVESRLKDCDFIVVKTYKDRADKFDRYLADVFYMPQESDPHKVAQEGTYLNQELLDDRLAVVYE